MIPYSKFRPSSLDRNVRIRVEDDEPNVNEWLVAPCSTNRDADLATESNWQVLLRELAKIDNFCEEHEQHCFNHWGCGHFTIVLVRPDSACAKLCEQFESALADYPLLADSHYSELEHEHAQVSWRNSSVAERREYLRRFGGNPKQARNVSIPPCERFSELLTKLVSP